jgi:hypothetical protein
MLIIVLLTRDLEYVVATDGPRVTITIPLEIGQLWLQFVNTLLPMAVSVQTPQVKWDCIRRIVPKFEWSKTSTGQQTVIIGHDGSTTKIFGDIRDEVLLEFETASTTI